MKHLIAAFALLILTLLLVFLQAWVSIAIGLLALGVTGYLPQIIRLHLSRRISCILLVLFIIFSFWQGVLQYRQEKTAKHESAMLSAALTSTQSFIFRIVVEPDRTPHPLNIFEPIFRPFYSSRGPGIYANMMVLGGGETVQPTSERPEIAPLYATYNVNKPPAELLRPPYKFQNVDRLVLDVAEMTLIQWLLTFGTIVLQENIVPPQTGTQGECPTIRSIHNSFSNNQFIGYLADCLDHQYFFPFRIDYPQNSALIGNIKSETCPLDEDKQRVILLSGSGYRLKIVLQYDGLSRMSPQDVSDLGIDLNYNNIDLPYVMTENFRISLTVFRDESSQSTDIAINELATSLRRDFDWNVYKDMLLLTRNK